MTTAREWYADHELPFPPVPAALEADLSPLDGTAWATADALRPLWETKQLAGNAAESYPAPSAAVGFAGRGLASNALYCNIVTEHIALFLEHGFDNITDGTDQRADIAVDYSIVERIIDRATVRHGNPIVVLLSRLRLHAGVFDGDRWSEHRTFDLLHHVLDVLG